MKKYFIGKTEVDSIELKCLVVSRGVVVDEEIYDALKETSRIHTSPMACDCMLLSDGTIVQLTDLGVQLRHLARTLNWNEAQKAEFRGKLNTPFTLKLAGGKPALCYEGDAVDAVSFPPKTDFYAHKTGDGNAYVGNAVLQGLDFVSFQCLWPCEYAAAGKPCEFCYFGGEFQALAEQKLSLPKQFPAEDVAEIVRYAVESVGVKSVQITGGSTHLWEKEAGYVQSYLQAIAGGVPGEILLYLTPPKDFSVLDAYFTLGAGRIAFSLEVWNEALAGQITPGKIAFSTRRRFQDALQYVAEKHPGKAFSNLIIGIEPLDSLLEGASWLASRGILPTASVWMPMGRPVRGSMTPPDLDFYRRVKETFAELYAKYGLSPSPCRGLNVCIEQDIARFAGE